MHTSLLPLLCCPVCRGGLCASGPPAISDLQAGSLRCMSCTAAYDLENGIPILAPREDLDSYADRWPSGLAHEHLMSRIEQCRTEYTAGGPFAAWVDTAAHTRGVVLDIATGPGSSLLGALVPLLTEETHVIATDASLYLLPRLKAAWETQSVRSPIDFVAMDGNRWPFGDGVLDAVTSLRGFGCVWDDPERKQLPRFGNAYREASRALKAGGRVFELCGLFAEDSETAAMLEANQCISASRGKLESFWRSLGLEVESAEELRRGQGRLEPGDAVPLSESDVWWEMLYVLRKAF